MAPMVLSIYCKFLVFKKPDGLRILGIVKATPPTLTIWRTNVVFWGSGAATSPVYRFYELLAGARAETHRPAEHGSAGQPMHDKSLDIAGKQLVDAVEFGDEEILVQLGLRTQNRGARLTGN